MDQERGSPPVGREEEYKFFNELINSKFHISVPPTIFVVGNKNQGKTYVLRCLTEGNMRCTWVNLEEEQRSRNVFESILLQISFGEKKVPVCENSVAFTTLIREKLKKNNRRKQDDAGGETWPYFFIFDRVDRAVEKNAKMITLFMRLAHQTMCNVCCIFISNLPWMNMRIGYKPEVTIVFSEYDNRDIIELLTRKSNCSEEDKPLYTSLAKIVLEVFQGASRDVYELRYIIDALFEDYIEPVKSGRCGYKTILFISDQPYFSSTTRKH